MLIRVKKHCCNWRKLQMKKLRLNPYILFQKINTGTYITMNSFKQKLSHQYQQWIWISELGTVVMQPLLQRLTWPHDFWPDPIVFLKTDMDLTPLHNTHVCSFQKFIFQFVCINKKNDIFTQNSRIMFGSETDWVRNSLLNLRYLIVVAMAR